MSSRNKNIQPDSNPGNMGNSGNPESGGGPFNMNMNNLGQILNNMDLNQVMGQLSQMMGGAPGGGPQGGAPRGGLQPPRQGPRDPRIQILQAMKPFLGGRRGRMVDGIGQLYNIATLVRGITRK